MKPVVVFDLDDTLYLERDYVRSGFGAVGAWAERELSISGVPDAAWELFTAGVRRTTLTDAFASLGRPLSCGDEAAAIRVYREHSPQIRLCNDAAMLLEHLAPVAHTAIVTDGPAVSQRAKVTALGLYAIIDPIVITAERGDAWHKPSPRAFEHVQAKFGASGQHYTYVADNPAKDFDGPRALAWRTIRIRRKHGLHADIDSPPGSVDLTIQSLAEAPEWFSN